MYFSNLSEPISHELAQAQKVVGPYGLVRRSVPLEVGCGDPPFSIYTSTIGNPAEVLSCQKSWNHKADAGNFDGAGGAIDPQRARAISVIESIERYSSCAWQEDDFIWATESELGNDAVAICRWPQCSVTEFNNPKCRNIAPDKRVPLRWVQGWSLTRHQLVFVPAFLVYLNFPVFSQSELFANSVSTGTAARSDLKQAVLSGIEEVVERDSIALTWLQKMPHPRLVFDEHKLSLDAREYVRVGTVPGIHTYVFDATTDYGIPVLYAVQESDHDQELAQIVAATCDLDPEIALAKLFRELASLKIALRMYKELPQKKQTRDEARSVVAGAVINAQLENRPRFDFLMKGSQSVHELNDIKPNLHGDDPLDWILKKLASRGAEVIAVDLTTDEARQAGQRVIKVLIPEAMPLSFDHYARYLAHPRLYKAPATMGYRVSLESEINPYIQPFA